MAEVTEDIQKTGYGPLWQPFIYVSIGFGIAAVAGIGVGIYFVIRKLSDIERSRNFGVATAILRYHEDQKLFEIRGFVNRSMPEVNQLIEQLDPKQPSDRDRLDARIKEQSHDSITLEDILRLVAVLNHTSLFILNEYVSPDVGMEFHPVITRMWELLAPVVEFERARRSGEARPLHAAWYTRHFQNLAERMLSPEYEERVRTRLGLDHNRSTEPL